MENTWETVEQLIDATATVEAPSDEFLALTDEIAAKLYDCPRLYVALSRSSADPEAMTSTPLISTKDGRPMLYLFTTLDKAQLWCNYYGHNLNGVPLLAEAKKADGQFRQLFPIAYGVGAQMVMINEGSAFVCLSLGRMVKRLELPIVVPGEAVSDIIGAEHLDLELPSFDILRTND